MARNHGLTGRARQLRRNGTDAEAKLWQSLRSRQLAGAKFRRQAPIDRYVADFLCAEAKLIVELDGGQHTAETDLVRTKCLEARGFRVIRFWNHDVLQNLDGVLLAIERELNTPPHPAQPDG